MWIKNTASGTSRLYDADLDADVSFGDSGTAQVPKDVGEALCDRYESIQPHETDSDSDSEDA